MLIDFEKVFKKFLTGRVREINPRDGDIDDLAIGLYEQWCQTPSDDLGGLSPKQYFGTVKSPQKLLGMLCDYIEQTGSAPDLLLDAIAERKDCEDGLIKIAVDYEIEKAKVAMSLLNEMQSDKALASFSEMFFQPDADERKLEEAAQILAQYPERAKQLLIERIAKADDRAKAYLADILVYAEPDERIFALLCELFLSGQNYQAYAAYLAKYGDPRAIEVLKEAASTADTIDYKEIAAAIDTLESAANKR